MEEDDDKAGPLALQVLAGTDNAACASPELDIGVEIRRLESEMNKLKEKLRLTTLTLYTVEKERDEALAQLALISADRDGPVVESSRRGSRAAPTEAEAVVAPSSPKMKLSAQLESLAMALHAASAEAEANDMELQLERKRRLAARAIADDLIRRLTSAADSVAGDNEGDAAAVNVTDGRNVVKGGEMGKNVIRVRKDDRRIPSRASAETVDRAIEHLRQRFQQMNVTIPIAREDDFVYRLGRDRLYIQIIQGKLVLRQSGRYVDLLQWLESRY